MTLAKTADRSILGTMNDYRFQLEYRDRSGRLYLSNPMQMSMDLSKTISLVLPEGYPLDAVLKLFGQELSEKNIKRFFSAPVSIENTGKPRLYIVK